MEHRAASAGIKLPKLPPKNHQATQKHKDLLDAFAVIEHNSAGHVAANVAHFERQAATGSRPGSSQKKQSGFAGSELLLEVKGVIAEARSQKLLKDVREDRRLVWCLAMAEHGVSSQSPSKAPPLPLPCPISRPTPSINALHRRQKEFEKLRRSSMVAYAFKL